jgi:hypothetical protein
MFEYFDCTGERRIDEQDIFHRVVFFLAAINLLYDST